MKLCIIAVLLTVASAIAGSDMDTVAEKQERELHYDSIYLPPGSTSWEECDYTKTVIRSSGEYGHTDFNCDLPIYTYHQIVAFHVVPLGAWSHENWISCWEDTDSHYSSMIHCDHEMHRGRVQVHMLCCHGNHGYYGGVAKAGSEGSFNMTGSSP